MWFDCSSAPASAVGDRRKHDRSNTRVASATSSADVSATMSCLHAAEFRERCRGLDMLRDLVANNPPAVSNNVIVVSCPIIIIIIKRNIIVALSHCCCSHGVKHHHIDHNVSLQPLRMHMSCRVTLYGPASATVVSAEPFSHGTGTLRCLQKEMATYRH